MADTLTSTPLPDDWIASPPAVVDLQIVRGRTFLLRYRLLVADDSGTITVTGSSLKYIAVDLSGCTCKAQVRDSDGVLVLDLTATGDDDGWLRITASATDTLALDEPTEDGIEIGHWDVLVKDAIGNVITPLRGRALLLDDYATEA
jgi:hypothetical protein